MIANKTGGELEDLQETRTPAQKQQDLIAWRRSQAWSMYSLGYQLTAIAEVLRVDISTISRDVKAVKEEATTKLGEYIQNLPAEHAKALAILDRLITEVWKVCITAEDDRVKLHAASVLAAIVAQRAALLGDADLIQQAMITELEVKEKLAKAADHGGKL